MDIEYNRTENFEKTKDDRRNQRYYRSCSIAWQFELEGIEVERELFRHYQEYKKFFGVHFQEKTKDHVLSTIMQELYDEELESDDSLFDPVLEGARKLEPHWMVRYYNDYSAEDEDGYIRISFDWKEHAERPSEIISEDEARAKFPVEEVEEWLVDALERAVEIANERHRKLEIMRDTEFLGKWIANTSLEKAEEAVDYKRKLKSLQDEYEERLKSLKSSVKAEAHRQASGILDEWEDRHVEEALEADYCEESTEYAPKFWKRYLRDPDGGYKPRHVIDASRRDDPESKIDPEEIFGD